MKNKKNINYLKGIEFLQKRFNRKLDNEKANYFEKSLKKELCDWEVDGRTFKTSCGKNYYMAGSRCPNCNKKIDLTR